MNCATFQLGPYTVQRRPWLAPGAEYVVLLRGVVIGKSVSMPDLGCCKWLHQQQRDQTFYAYSTERLTDKPYGFTAVHQVYVRKVIRKQGRQPKQETIADIAKALAGG